jgi:hypothetical protein
MAYTYQVSRDSSVSAMNGYVLGVTIRSPEGAQIFITPVSLTVGSTQPVDTGDFFLRGEVAGACS